MVILDFFWVEGNDIFLYMNYLRALFDTLRKLHQNNLQVSRLVKQQYLNRAIGVIEITL